ncbi:MAG: DUF4417 domain-containing protein [Eubacterium sp.]|nr:DUF4417 domain-containing protein [Eubacterium sp.]
MSQINSARSGCKDVFRAFLVKNANYEGFLEIPSIVYGDYKPQKLISFSKCISSTDYKCWVHFYEDDASFERIWNNPQKYLPILKRYAGVISPDFSLYRDMPLVMQFWNIYRNRAIGSWLQDCGIPVITNIRYSDSRTYTAACLGVPKGGTIAIGSHGCIKCKIDREEFIEGLDYMVQVVHPKVIVVYGTAPDYIFEKYRKIGIEILHFDSEFSISRKEN